MGKERVYMARGGSRKGAGRKAGVKRIPLNIKLPEWMVDWLRAEIATARSFNAKASQSSMIEKALIKCHDLKPPEPEGPPSKTPAK